MVVIGLLVVRSVDRGDEPEGFGRVVAAVAQAQAEGGPDREIVDLVFADEPWAVEVLDQTQGKVEPDADLGWRLSDNTQTWVHVQEGRRLTATVDDPHFRVWMFGGSTTFGVGQRDVGTIASWLVRLAMEDGERIDVENFGVPGYVTWQESRVFAELLEGGERPDLAIFFDGPNELGVAYERETFGLLDAAEDVTMAISDEDRRNRQEAAAARGYDEQHDPERQASLAATQYARGVRRARALSARYSVPVCHYWQPWLATIPADRPGVRLVAGSLDFSEHGRTVAARTYDRAMQLSGVDPVDLSRMFDDVDHPVYFDWSHSNEAGARDQALAILDHLRPVLTGDDPARRPGCFGDGAGAA